jgi:hypothetical protein
MLAEYRTLLEEECVSTVLTFTGFGGFAPALL